MSMIALSDEIDLWAAVIDRMLDDATLCVSRQLKGRTNTKDIRPVKPNNTGVLSKREVFEGRRFISGECGGLADICRLLDVDYVLVRRELIKKYNECEPYFSEEWRGKIT